jgi:hypothetical protein
VFILSLSWRNDRFKYKNGTQTNKAFYFSRTGLECGIIGSSCSNGTWVPKPAGINLEVGLDAVY